MARLYDRGNVVCGQKYSRCWFGERMEKSLSHFDNWIKNRIFVCRKTDIGVCISVIYNEINK